MQLQGKSHVLVHMPRVTKKHQASPYKYCEYRNKWHRAKLNSKKCCQKKLQNFFVKTTGYTYILLQKKLNTRIE